MIGRADIEGSKSNVAMNAWLLGGLIKLSFTEEELASHKARNKREATNYPPLDQHKWEATNYPPCGKQQIIHHLINTNVQFCFTMIGRANIEGSKSNVAMNAWLLGGLIKLSFTEEELASHKARNKREATNYPPLDQHKCAILRGN